MTRKCVRLIRGLQRTGNPMNGLERLAGWCVLLTGWRRYIASFAAGLVSALSMAPVDLFIVLFITLPVMVWIMDGVYGDSHPGRFGRLRAAFLPGWWFGLGYFLAGLWWIANAFLVEADLFAWALPLAVIAFPAFLAIFFGLATLLAHLLWSDGRMRLFAFATGFAALEFARGHVLTGFPWNTLGYAALTSPITMQSVSVFGLYGMTFLALLVFATPLVLVATPGKKRSAIAGLVLTGLLMSAHAGFGLWRLVTHQTDYVDAINIRIMQPNIPQAVKLDPLRQDEVVETYLSLSASREGEAQSGLEATTYLIWPESAFPFLLTERRDVLGAIADLLPRNTQLITGAMRAEPGAGGDPYGKVYNSVLLIEENGEIAAAADKTHLVPFGEYLPFQDVLESLGFQQLTKLQGGFEAGASRRLLAEQGDHPFLPLICYEIIFSGRILDGPDYMAGEQARPTWIVNLTNDAWYGYTPGPFQHLRQSQVRAVEEGLPVIRVANTGVSAVIDAYGRQKVRIGLGETGVRDTALPTPSAPTFFARYGHNIFLVLLAAGFLMALGGRFGMKR